MPLPYIPETITVHLGRPNDRSARNVTVSFPDYIKNVASSEIYPTWPENAIRANLYAQISFALNRIYTEWYRSQGYDFDITNSTAFDQAYVDGRDIFDNIAQIADELFDEYLVRPGAVEPLFAQYCNGTTVTCEGLSQWGTVPLAEAGRTPYEILVHYYGPDLNIMRDTPVAPNLGTYPGVLLQLGDISDDVRTIQLRLNRISTNYPAIPKIYPVNGVFEESTRQAVLEFQRVFGLTPDGIVGKATWYRIAYLFTSIARLAELTSEGVRPEDVENLYPTVLRPGDQGESVRILQYYLAAISYFYPAVSLIQVDGIYGPATEAALRQFQQAFGLTADGIAGRQTAARIAQVYDTIVRTLPDWATSADLPLFPRRLVEGMSGEDVAQVQQWLGELSAVYPELGTLPVTSYFGSQTEAAVRRFQSLFGYTPTGSVGPLTWTAMARQVLRLRESAQTSATQYPGYPLTASTTGGN